MNIKLYRKELGLTVRELSEKSNVAIGYISGLENGKVDNPSKDTMVKIAGALCKTVPEVFFNPIDSEVIN